MSCSTCKVFENVNSKRIKVIRRCSNVAYELPNWARSILSSKMGSIEVSARDSYELYLIDLGAIKPKEEYGLFCKKFAEIFEVRGRSILIKIKSNRDRHIDLFVENKYFWRLFDELFEIDTGKAKSIEFWLKVERSIWEGWNAFLKTLKNIWGLVCKVGLQGIMYTKMILSGSSKKKEEVKWK